MEIGKAEGPMLLAVGKRLSRCTDGFYLALALLVGSTAAMRINRNEFFGPVASVIGVKDYEEALAVTNDTLFGLSAGITPTATNGADNMASSCRLVGANSLTPI